MNAHTPVLKKGLPVLTSGTFCILLVPVFAGNGGGGGFRDPRSHPSSGSGAEVQGSRPYRILTRSRKCGDTMCISKGFHELSTWQHLDPKSKP